MEIYQLRSFVTVAREGNLTRASDLLFTSQPAVSAHIKSLEDELGVILFERTSKGMKITSAGLELVAQAEKVLSVYQELHHRANHLKDKIMGRLQIGTVGDPTTLKLDLFLNKMSLNYPNIELKLRQRVSGAILDDIRDGHLDGGYVMGKENEERLTLIKLKRLTMYIAAPAAWKDKIENADWQEIMALPWVWPAPCSSCNQIAEELFRLQGAKPLKAVEVDYEKTTKYLISSGIGIGLLHEEKALLSQKAGEVVLWKGGHGSADLMFAYSSERKEDPLVSAMVSQIREIWEIS